MQAVILAGGLGEKLRPMTHVTAKLMLKVYDRPFLEHHVVALRRSGIKDIAILTGHLGDQIKEFFGNGQAYDVSITYSEDPMLGSGGALRNASAILEDEFVVINGDTYLPEDYSMIIEAFQRSGKPALMTVYDNAGRIRSNNVAVVGGRITEYNNNETKPNFTHVDAGVTILKKNVLDVGREKFSLENDVYPALIAKQQLACFVTRNRFFDIRTLQRLENIRKILESK